MINESNTYSYETLEDEKNKIESKLDEYKNFLLSNIKFKDGELLYKGFENLDIEKIITEIESNSDVEFVTLFNVETFLRKINQILELKAKDTKKLVRDEFIGYYISMDQRIETLSGEDQKDTVYDQFYDMWDGEESVIKRDQYDKEKFNIQVELLKLQEWVKTNKKRVAIVFEGRDAAGKGSTIKRFTEYLDPKSFRVVALGIPTEEEKNNWLQRYEKHLPKDGEIVFFDRSYYNRAVVEPAMRYCSEEQYKDFMESVLPWEEKLIKKGLILIKFWFSISKEKQQKRFDLRKKSPLKYWKFSPNDAKVVDKWDLITFYKNKMFSNTSSSKSPWVIINSNDKRVGRLNAMRYVLNVINYKDKDDDICKYYPEVVNILN